jgi:hypothetical protein
MTAPMVNLITELFCLKNPEVKRENIGRYAIKIHGSWVVCDTRTQAIDAADAAIDEMMGS